MKMNMDWIKTAVGAICILAASITARAVVNDTNFTVGITETNAATVTVRTLIPSRAATQRYSGTISNTGTNSVQVGQTSLSKDATNGWSGILLVPGDHVKIPNLRILPDGTIVAWPGAYVVVLTNAGTARVSVTESFEDSYIAPPVAVFTLSSTNGTGPLKITVTDSSTGNITNRHWTFTGVGFTNTVNTTESIFDWRFSGPSTQTVVLTVSGPGGSSTATNATAVTVTNSIDAPLITFLVPTNGFVSTSTTVAVHGWFIDPNATVLLGTNVLTISWTNSMLFTFSAPALTNAGSLDLTITNPSGLTATKTNAFTYKSH